MARSAFYYPSAKQQLIESGISSERVEAMPVAQVLLLQSARATQYAFDETFKWTYLPLSEAQKHMAESEKRLIRDGYLGPPNVQNKSPLPIASILLPAIHKASYAPVRLQRRLAALQAIEAIRMYAASHGGMLPQTLDQITEVPVPVDPLTNAPLDYRLDGDTAIIDLAAPAIHPGRHSACRYIVRIRE
jgi:hypothetical protein